jgi:hypothetical protein
MSYHFKFGNGKKLIQPYILVMFLVFDCSNKGIWLRLVYEVRGPSNGTARLENCKKLLKCQNYLLLRDI